MKKLIFVILFIAGCSSAERKNQYTPSDDQRPLVDEKYSISADRKNLDELRSQIPPEIKKENDESALMLEMTTEVKKPPADIRNQFDKVLRKKRELMDKDLKKEREDFTKNEKKKRDSLLASLAKNREDFNREKHTREERADYYKELDGLRQDHFANEREKRNDYESDVRDRRKNFEDYIREKTNEFNQEHRAYTKRYDELKKKERDDISAKINKANSRQNPSPNSSPNSTVVPFNPEVTDLDEEIEQIRQKQGSPLESGN